MKKEELEEFKRLAVKYWEEMREVGGNPKVVSTCGDREAELLIVVGKGVGICNWLYKQVVNTAEKIEDCDVVEKDEEEI